MLKIPEQRFPQVNGVQSPEAVRRKINAFAAAMGDSAFARFMASEIVTRTRPHEAIPEVYAPYRQVVRDGIEFFLSQVSKQRLVDLAHHQLNLPVKTGKEQRLLELAKQFPTLHKLGQLIARNPNIDPAVKRWLIPLENGAYGTPPDEIQRRIGAQLELTDRRHQVRLFPHVLSEASVGAVMRFDWHPTAGQKNQNGVFKVLKPAIRRQLQEELAILEQTAAFFEEHRHRYALEDFQFLDIFQEVRDMLVSEIDLAAEQRYLVEAKDFFGTMEDLHIPEKLPLSTDTLTAMEYLEGPKITDAPLNGKERERLASVLFEALVCRPLFCGQSSGLFHGDPHAGNILAVPDPKTGRYRIGLIDWTLAGHLPLSDRRKTVALIQAVMKKDLSGIRRVVHALAIQCARDDKAYRKPFRQLVLDLMHSASFARLSQIKQTFKLLEKLTFAGFVFPAGLMLFRKAIFTLEGVINDLFPAFDMDAASTHYLTTLIAKEVPDRIGRLFFPLADKPEHYTSLISNIELNALVFHRYVDTVGACYRSMIESVLNPGQSPR